ncbi:pyridoxamine 5'-phosphate oxidase family protein [Xanthobacter sp. KR7-65]|uniref:pyridoxamine 5'-phosphate oxidase family protein n=1 Tax=Xanthobacter sp. KR7-65 TaxID=3156612 RepID=UPI0032B3C445
MADMTLADVAGKMRKIDFTTLFTKSDGGALAGRPMSNNGDVDYDGDSFFFALDDSRVVKDIAREPSVGLSLQGSSGMLGQRPFFVTIEGAASLVREKQQFEAHWNSDLDRWFDKGVDTPGLVMIKVEARRLHWWDGEDEGEVVLP